MSLCSRSGVGLTMSCRSDSGLFAPLPAGMCTGWTRRRGLTGESFSCGGGCTNVGMGVGGLQYRMFLEGFSGGLDIAGELFLLFLFLGGGEANISGSAGFSSVSVGLSSSGEVGVSNICLDSVANNFLLVFAVSGPFTSFLVLHTISWFSRSEVCAFVLGNICERFAHRDLC